MEGFLEREMEGFSAELQVASCFSCLCEHEKRGGN